MSKSTGNFILLNEAVQGHRMITLNDVTKPIGWTADSTRVALADGGDGLDDANFSLDVADTAIMRLYNEIKFAEEAFAAPEPALQSPAHQFHAKVFAARLDSAIVEADAAYASMRFRDALVAALFGLQEARDAYRKACALLREEPSAAVMRRFVEVMCVTLSPICPHFCDHLWRNVLRRPGSVMDASWPVVGVPDAAVLRAGDYVAQLETRVRSAVDKQLAKKKTVVSTVTLHVAREVPALHKRVIDMMRALPRGKDLLTRLSVQLKDEIAKPDMKEAMKVAASVHANFEVEGERAFETALPFDELATLQLCKDMLAHTLGLDALVVTGEPPANANTEAVPGKPLIVMS